LNEASTSGEGGAPDAPPLPEKKKPGVNWLRIGLLVALTAGLWIFGKQSGLIDDFDVERVREMVRDAGVLGVIVYIGIFALGELVHIPGIVFVAAGLLSWGKVLGFPISLLASVVSVSVSFVVVRVVGGRALASLNRPLFKRVLDRLDQRPIRTVVVLRLLLFLAPPLNYALAMTNLRFRDYVIGSAIGLVLPLLGVALLFDWVLSLVT